ncbi:MAG: DUF3576 domain-containing protein [Alphaproteobacteria bacterium]|nr:DUF3576 domain-containing protein [Alphaproteobacteria bacterium]
MRIFPVAVMCLVLAGCAGDDIASSGTVDATTIAADSSKMTLGVNRYLWHATLDTLSFMPLASADPFGGVVITDWYTAPENPNERMKLTIYILDRRLRADGIRVATFRQIRQGDIWQDAPVNTETSTKLEDAILTRARELRLAAGDKG